MSASLARYLKDFSAPEPVISVGANPFASSFDDSIGSMDFSDLPQLPSPDHQEEIDNAFADGRAAATSELQDLHEQELAARDEAHRTDLQNMKATLESEMSAIIAGRFEALIREVTNKLTDQVTDVLIPVLGSMLAEKAAADLAQRINTIFEEPDGIALIVRGPANLFSVFSENIDGRGFTVKHIETKDIDLTVEHEDTVMVTRLSAWAEATRLLSS